jgi:hypothetical protein
MAKRGERGIGEREHARVYPNARSDAAAASKTNAWGVFLGEHRRSMLMSVVCAVQFNDPERTVTRMSVSGNCFYDSAGNISHGFEIGRALGLAVAAYESRMKRPPPLIKEPEQIAGYPDILQYQYRVTDDGKVFTTTAAEYRRGLLFASIFTGIRSNGDADPPQPDGKRRRPRIRSMAEWYEFQRRKDLRRLARADPELRREILKTMDTCPCCDQRLPVNGGSNEPARTRTMDPILRGPPAPAKPDATKAARREEAASDGGRA